MADQNDDLNIKINSDASGAVKGSKDTASAVKGVVGVSKELESSFRRLKSAIDPTFAAQEKYNRMIAEGKRLMQADLITRKEYYAVRKAAKTQLDEETASIARNTAAGKAAATAAVAAAAMKKAEAAAAKQAAVEAARAETAAAREAAREQAAAAKQAAAEKRKAIQDAARAAREAAAEQKRLDRESAASARQANRERIAAAAQAAKQAKEVGRQQAAAAREAAEALQRQAAAERQAAQAAQELRASIDPAYASQQRYNQTMAQATQLLMTNKLRQGEWNAIQRQAKAQMDLNVRSLGRMNSVYVQMGYQAQDVTASLASGISPMVILAQQSGQTAAALSQLGGTIGKVASFIAGPWGAAIIGVTLLLSYLTAETEEEKEAAEAAKKATVDLKNAEEVRAASLDKLTKSLKEYNKAQREANITREEGLQLESQAANQGIAKASRDINKSLDAIAAAQAKLKNMGPMPTSKGGMEIYIAQQLAAQNELKRANADYQSAVKALAVAQEAAAFSRIAQIEREVELETDASEKLKAGFEAERDAANEAYMASAKSAKDAAKLKSTLLEITHRQKAAEEALSATESKRQNKARTGNPIEDARRAAMYAESQGFMVGAVGKNGVSKGAGHQGGRAVDINAIGGLDAADPTAKARLDKLALEYQKMGYTVLWNGKRYSAINGITLIAKGKHQHRDHLHVEAPETGAFQKGSSDAANEAIDERIAAQQRLADAVDEIRKQALDALLEDLSYEQDLAEEDYNMQLELQDKKIEAIREYYGEESRELIRAQRDKLKIQKRQEQFELEQFRNGINEKLELAQRAADAERQIQSIGTGSAGDTISYKESAGIISAREALVERRALMDQDYQNEVAHQARLYQLRRNAIQMQLADQRLPVEQRNQLNSQLISLEAEYQNQSLVMNRNYQAATVSMNQQMATELMGRWREITSTMSQQFSSTFQGLWTHSTTLFDGIINLADQLVYKVFDMGAKVVENWATQMLAKRGITAAEQATETAAVVAGETARTAAVGTAAAAQTGIKAGQAATESGIIAATTSAKVASEGIKTAASAAGATAQTATAAGAGISEIGTSAAVAAAGAYKSTVVIPFIGPVAAPVAAGVALAAVLGFGALISAKGGMGEVPSDQLAMVHKKEMILPAWIAEPMRNSLKGARAPSSGGMLGGAMAAGSAAREATSNRGGDMNFSYAPQNSLQDMSFEKMMQRDGDGFRRWIKREIRKGNFPQFGGQA